MHIETLEAVHRESRRLPPIQKASISGCLYCFIAVRNTVSLTASAFLFSNVSDNL